MKQTLDRKIRTKLRLGEIERLIKVNRIIVPPPTRQTLIKMCERGDFEAVGNAATPLGWLVYEDAFWAWVEKMK